MKAITPVSQFLAGLIAMLPLASPIAAATPTIHPTQIPISAVDLTPPDGLGPYNVGTMTFSAMMTGGRLTKVQVFYPTLAISDCDATFTITSVAGTFQMRSLFCATANVPAAPGPFPLVVHDHGGGGPGNDFQRVSQLPLHETMASHGFVTVVAPHSANAVVRIRDLSMLIDTMLARNATPGDLLSGCIDPARIGVSGISAGGAAAIGAAGGQAADGIAADPRILAMALYEPASTIYSLNDARTIAIPYLVMGGTQNRNGIAVPALFNTTVLALPRIYVQSPNAAHFSYVTGMGTMIDQTREAALLADPTLPEPLTHFIPTNAAAAQAYTLWNWGEILFPALGLGVGGGRNLCPHVGVDSVRSLDTNPQDAYTDSPPFMATDAFILEPSPPEDVMVPLIKLYTISFWKVFLEGDHRYERYLSPGYAKRNQLEAIVYKED